MEAHQITVTRLRAWLGIGFFTAALFLVVFSAFPIGVIEEKIEIPQDFVLPLPTQSPQESAQIDQLTEQVTSMRDLLGNRLLVLERPIRIYKQDNAVIRLSITMDNRGILTASASSPGQPSEKMTAEAPGIYDAHNIVAIARLDLAGFEVDGKEIRQPILPEKEATFRWNIRAKAAGTYRGMVWLHIDLVPKAGGLSDQVLLLARQFELEVVSVFGLPGKVVRLAGIIGLVLGTVIEYPLIRDWIRRFYRLARRRVSGSGSFDSNAR